MKTFYNIVIAFWILGVGVMIWLIQTSVLPWWKWIVFGVALMLVEFGCFAWRDKKHSSSRPSRDKV